MTMLRAALPLFGILWLLALAALVAVGMLNGTVTVRGLLRHKTPTGPGGLSPGRLQLFLVTLAIASLYLTALVATSGPGLLPDAPLPWIIVLGASNAIYLASQVVSTLRARARSGTSGP